jgi:hypothetical protein
MPLEDLNAYGSDSGSSIHSRHSDAVPKCRQYDSDPNATDADSEINRSEAEKFDGLSDSNDSSSHTPAQKSKRQCFTPERRQSKYVVGPSDSECDISDRDELYDQTTRKRGFKRPRIQWDLVSSWSKTHVAQDDIEGEIARIMAKSLYDAKTNVTPKFNARAISDFRFKTVRLCLSLLSALIVLKLELIPF